MLRLEISLDFWHTKMKGFLYCAIFLPYISNLKYSKYSSSVCFVDEDVAYKLFIWWKDCQVYKYTWMGKRSILSLPPSSYCSCSSTVTQFIVLTLCYMYLVEATQFEDEWANWRSPTTYLGFFKLQWQKIFDERILINRCLLQNKPE